MNKKGPETSLIECINKNTSHHLSHVISALMELAFSRGLWVRTTTIKQRPEMATISHLLAARVMIEVITALVRLNQGM